MIFAHISDTHLGFRAYSGPSQGFNQREIDVMTTFQRCLDAILDREPDIVVHSGDFFDVVRPSNATIVEAYRKVAAFQHRRKGQPFILIGGNHDTPRSSESGNILKLFEGIPGMRVVPTAATSLDFPDLELEVLCIPSQSLTIKENVDWAPQFGRRYGLLTVHGIATQAMLPDVSDFEIEQTRHDLWSYVALGDFHKHQVFGTNVCYAGSTDFTSTNIWEEIGTPKGWVAYDTEVGILEFHDVETRAVIDLPILDADGLTATELMGRLLSAASWDVERPIVRQVVRNVLPEIRAKLDVEGLRSLQEKALTYRLQTYPPTASNVALSADGRARPLEQSWTEHIASAKLNLGVPRDEVRQLGLDLLQEVKELETSPTEA